MNSEQSSALASTIGEFRRFMASLFMASGNTWIDLDLTMAQFRALLLIARSGGMHGRELASALGLSPSSVSTIIDYLVERGYVYREEDTTDRRITHNRPTAAGQAFFAQMMAARDEQIKGILQRLDADDLALVGRAFATLRGVTERAAREQQPELLPPEPTAPHTSR